MTDNNFTTTGAGRPIPSDELSLTLGPDGPVLMQDFYLIEALADFNRERVAERQPHAKGAGAFGRFEVTNDVSAYTRAAVFQPGTTTEAFVRVTGNASERGSADTLRDTRGFSVKFYTSEGNYDIVGNNVPMFFIRDAIKFPNLIRASKRRADNDCHDHNMVWDFWTLSPESAHLVTLVMGDRGIPKTFRHMNGYGLHTFSWVNDAGEIVWVKYHFKSDQGVESLTQEEADRLAGTDPDCNMRDLHEAIARGDHPSWSLKVQIMPFEDAKTYRINPFDVTKVWPHADYPLIDVGTLTLDRNITDHHTEVEQATFTPASLVPGIGLSPDRLLLGRSFAYADAHRHRVGVNHNQIPVNAPKVGVRSYTKDGAMRFYNRTDPVYVPNSVGGPHADPARAAEVRWAADGHMVRAAQTLRPDDDDWSQARDLLLNVMNDEERERLVHNVVLHVSDGVKEPILSRVFEYWRNIDIDTGDKIERGVRAATNT
ncbi:catalase KatA [Mycobacteroides abscessus subsp. massiliense]|uniref:catalase n=1 Tax=Mycobacteroides abscessus TaxID=36809 RepID=UPI0009A74FE1|nr:catalase [Mycobacteroides abscessus]SKH27017.1 catalase KatA [Mycobacteroides abscessus subsp. massiliense]SKH49104.1 catalase KatA [Mycobacteroides abscessus subsp. massiliense]SKI05743.1 catalase KatA [Mycobacteroides abscessus subsp. massiliense]SKJ91239.1 catalase KatA [Mycobacteroides abscessus subsp. massiliense]